MKIILINHTFQLPRFSKRWKLLSEQHRDLDITLITPVSQKWDIKDSMIFGANTTVNAQCLDIDNFHIVPVHTRTHKYRSWTSPEMVKVIQRINPDIVYHLGTHKQDSLFQCIKTVRKKLSKTAKAVAFSMRGPTMDLKYPKKRETDSYLYMLVRLVNYYYQKYKLNYLNKNCDAMICHYPDAVECFRKEGFNKPIYMSTQVGVDTDIFYPNENSRLEIRNKLNLGDSFVFGCACRFIPDKGLFEILDALPPKGNWKCLLMGKGDEEFTKKLREIIHNKHFDDKVILTGFLEWNDMAKYWNAVDCAIHVPRTTPAWQETFSLSVVQAMATGKPIIGNDSGSVPYQIGPNGIIVPEGNIDALSKQINWMIDHPSEGLKIGQKMKQYAVGHFSIHNLNNQFYDIIQDIYNGTYNTELTDMVSYKESVY